MIRLVKIACGAATLPAAAPAPAPNPAKACCQWVCISACPIGWTRTPVSELCPAGATAAAGGAECVAATLAVTFGGPV